MQRREIIRIHLRLERTRTIATDKRRLPEAIAAMSTELARQSTGPLTSAIDTRAEHYERASRAEWTWAKYQAVWRQWERWCALNGWPPIPADIRGVKGYVAWLADKGRTVATVNTYLSAIAAAHSIAGQPFDRAALRDTIKGIRREKAKPLRQARPLLGGDIQAILSDLAPGAAADARDAALLAIGFAGALRRSELVGLDWQEQGRGDGFVTRDDRGLVVTLLRTKGGKGEPETVIVPSQDMPTACEALERWAKMAGLRSGEPVFRPIDKGQRIGSTRLTDRSVAAIIKSGCVLARWRTAPVRRMQTRSPRCAAATAYVPATARPPLSRERRSGRSDGAAATERQSWWLGTCVPPRSGRIAA